MNVSVFTSCSGLAVNCIHCILLSTMNKIVIMILVVVLLLVTYQLIYCMVYNSYSANYYKRRKKLLQMISLTSSMNRKQRKPRKLQEYWIAPGRTRVWWENFVSGNVLPSE